MCDASLALNVKIWRKISSCCRVLHVFDVACLGTHDLARSRTVQWGAVAPGRSLRFLFVMSAPDRKELLQIHQMSDEDVFARDWISSPFAFHTPCHTAVRPAGPAPRRPRPAGARPDPDPGTRQTRDGPVVGGHGPSDRRGWHAGSVNPIAVPGRHYRNAHPPASSRTRTGSRLLLPYRFTTIQISRRRDAPQPQKCPASAVGSRPPMPCGTATPWAGGSRTRVRSSGRWCRRGEGKGTV